jgi:hypothetical protein
MNLGMLNQRKRKPSWLKNRQKWRRIFMVSPSYMVPTAPAMAAFVAFTGMFNGDGGGQMVGQKR